MPSPFLARLRPARWVELPSSVPVPHTRAALCSRVTEESKATVRTSARSSTCSDKNSAQV